MEGTEKQVKWANDIIDKAIQTTTEQKEKAIESNKSGWNKDGCEEQIKAENSLINQLKIDTGILEMMRDKLSAKQIIDARFVLDELEPIREFCKYYNIDYSRASRVKYTNVAGEPKKYWGRLDSEPSESTDKEILIIATSIFDYIKNVLNE